MYDEMLDASGALRPEYAEIAAWIEEVGLEALAARRAEAEALFRRVGITFAVYGEGGDPERLIPFDLIPRVFGAAEWARIEAGCIQRARALNAFLTDVYTGGEIVKAGKIPEGLVYENPAYEKVMQGMHPPGGTFSHIIGVDLVCTGPGEYHVLEDNCRTPS
ncbi:MAG: circularly permuted type 2 ATP-grasp protein, partial [Pseudomonadota bacterium]